MRIVSDGASIVGMFRRAPNRGLLGSAGWPVDLVEVSEMTDSGMVQCSATVCGRGGYYGGRCKRPAGHAGNHRRKATKADRSAATTSTGTVIAQGTRVRFTRNGLGVSRRDDLSHVVASEVANIGDVGTVAFRHPNVTKCADWVYVEVDSKTEPGLKLYVGVSPSMIESAE
jgi:hypothetical protein